MSPYQSPSLACSCSKCRQSKYTLHRTGLGQASYTQIGTSEVLARNPPLAKGRHEVLGQLVADRQTV